MPRLSYLVDTDIIIDWLQGRPHERQLFLLSELLQKYADQPLGVADALIAATAWTRRLPLVTRNRKHYDFIREITLIDPRQLADPGRD